MGILKWKLKVKLKILSLSSFVDIKNKKIGKQFASRDEGREIEDDFGLKEKNVYKYSNDIIKVYLS